MEKREVETADGVPQPSHLRWLVIACAPLRRTSIIVCANDFKVHAALGLPPVFLLLLLTDMQSHLRCQAQSFVLKPATPATSRTPRATLWLKEESWPRLCPPAAANLPGVLRAAPAGPPRKVGAQSLRSSFVPRGPSSLIGRDWLH